MKKDWNYCYSLDIQAELQPDKKAVITEQDSISYAALKEGSCRLAGELSDKGLKSGDTILIFMPNCIEYTVAFFAAVRLRLNIVLANALYKESELKPLLNTAKPKAAFVKDDMAESLLHSIDESLTTVRLPKNGSAVNLYTFSHLNSTDEACICISTSGSTGTPKIVSNSYENEGVNAMLYVNQMQVTKDDVILTSLPVTQRFGMAAMLGSCMMGATFVTIPRFHAMTMLSLIEKYQVSVQYGVPTMFLKEIEAYETAETTPDISSLRTGVVAGASCSEDIFQWFEAQSGCRLLNCYGTSEIGGVTMTKLEDSKDVRYHTCGQSLEGADLEIKDHDGRLLPAGKPGEIICHVPWVMNGYVREPELTARMFDRNGAFLTGDIGILDADRHLTICGRRKDMIIRGGYNIFPAELEHALQSLPGVLEACVTGYQDTLLGERIIAFVRTADDTASEEQTRKELALHIAKYKLPDRILYMERIPKLPNGKFDYPALKQFLKK